MDYNFYYQRQYSYGQGPVGMYQTILPSDTLLIDDITKAIIAEAQAYYFYERLAELATNEQDRQVILRIQLNEAKHYHWFRPILRRLGGEHPQIPGIELPTRFEDGIRTIIRDELEAADFYMDIASRANSNHIQRHFMNASIDEQRHASWLQYILINLQNK